MSTKRLAALVAAGLLALGGGVGVAGALSGGASGDHRVTPAQAEDGLATAEEARANAAADDTTPTNDATSADTEDGGGDQLQGGNQNDNHGAVVSETAHNTPSGPGKGEAVSAVARTNGQGQSANRGPSANAGPGNADDDEDTDNRGRRGGDDRDDDGDDGDEDDDADEDDTDESDDEDDGTTDQGPGDN